MQAGAFNSAPQFDAAAPAEPAAPFPAEPADAEDTAGAHVVTAKEQRKKVCDVLFVSITSAVCKHHNPVLQISSCMRNCCASPYCQAWLFMNTSVQGVLGGSSQSATGEPLVHVSLSLSKLQSHIKPCEALDAIS